MRALVVVCALTLGATPAAFEAVRSGDVASLKRALDGGASANATDETGQTLLMHAAVYLPVEGMRLLVDRGADVNLAGRGGATALMAASGDFDKVRLLVERGADVNARSSGGNTAVRHAMGLAAGTETVLYLLKKGAKPEARDLNAAVRRSAMLTRAMLDAGAPVTDEAVRRAIGLAEILRLLAEKAPEYKDRVALQRAVKAATAPGAGQTDLMSRVFFGRLEQAKELIELGADVNAKDNRGRTALMYAAGGDGGVEPLRLLLAKGADPAAKDVRGDTALDIARQRGRKEIVEALGGTAESRTEGKPTGDGKLRPVRDSIVKAVGLMDAAGPVFYKINGCVSCHSQSIPQMASSVARKKGLPVSEVASKAQAEAVAATMRLDENKAWQLGCTTVGGYVATLSYDLVGLAAEGYPRSRWTDLASNCLAKAQAEDGGWILRDLRQPLGNGDGKYTALSIRALLAYPLPGLKEEYAKRVARAAAYLETSPLQDVQNLSFRILGLRWAGKTEAIPQLAAKLAALQNSSGGWSQQPEMAPDAYATAVALWALHEGAERRDAAWQRGAAYLRGMQKEDGSWHVRSRGFGFQPYRETGFPHDHDQWISSAATGFAVLALAPLVETK